MLGTRKVVLRFFDGPGPVSSAYSESRFRFSPIILSTALNDRSPGIYRGGGIDLLSLSPMLTLRRRTVFISFKKAAILSVGTLTVGCPALRVLPAAALIGASTGGTVGLRLARADARNEFARATLGVQGALNNLTVGGGGGGGGGGFVANEVSFRAESYAVEFRQRTHSRQ